MHVGSWPIPPGLEAPLTQFAHWVLPRSISSRRKHTASLSRQDSLEVVTAFAALGLLLNLGVAHCSLDREYKSRHNSNIREFKDSETSKSSAAYLCGIMNGVMPETPTLCVGITGLRSGRMIDRRR